jgi:putative membrane protein
MKKSIVWSLMVTAALTFLSCESRKETNSTEIAEDQNDKNLEKSDIKKDAEFAVDATDGGLYEVQVATLAVKKATSPQVKQFAQMMVDDHTKANNELRSLAEQKGIALPDVLSENCQKKYYDLDQKAQGAEFDKAYIDLMVKDHKDDIDKFEKEANKGEDPELKLWASEKLAALRHHLEEAERIKDVVKGK